MKSRMNTLRAAAVAASILVSAPALFAAGPANQTPAPKAAALSQQDQNFVSQAWIINETEIRLGNDAQQKATNADVKTFGKTMVADHTKLQQELTVLAAKDAAAFPKAIDKANQELVDRLGKLSGSDFDKQYMTAMISGHEEAVAAFEKEAKDKAQTAVDKWAAEAQSMLEHHLEMARKTGKEVGAADQGAASSAVPASHVEHASNK
jgi:putative membrane protein